MFRKNNGKESIQSFFIMIQKAGYCLYM